MNEADHVMIDGKRYELPKVERPNTECTWLVPDWDPRDFLFGGKAPSYVILAAARVIEDIDGFPQHISNNQSLATALIPTGGEQLLRTFIFNTMLSLDRYAIEHSMTIDGTVYADLEKVKT